MSVIATTPIRQVTSGTLIQLPTPSAAPAQRILAVEFVSADERTWTAIGGGDTLAAAIASARESCPDGSWQLLDWNDLYGD
jgi:xanthine/CO dehydrogenase XdhC/CoxF family maturation factor